MLQLSFKLCDNTKYLLSYVRTSSSGTIYVLIEHDDGGQFSLYAITADIVPCYSYPVSF